MIPDAPEPGASRQEWMAWAREAASSDLSVDDLLRLSAYHTFLAASPLESPNQQLELAEVFAAFAATKAASK